MLFRSAVRQDSLIPPSLGVVAFRNAFRNEEAGSDYGLLMAGAMLIMAPQMLGFVVAQCWFIESLTAASVSRVRVRDRSVHDRGPIRIIHLPDHFEFVSDPLSLKGAYPSHPGRRCSEAIPG